MWWWGQNVSFSAFQWKFIFFGALTQKVGASKCNQYENASKHIEQDECGHKTTCICLHAKDVFKANKWGDHSQWTEELVLRRSWISCIPVCRPMKTTSIRGARYFLTFIDKFSCKTWVYVLKAKNKVVRFKKWKTLVERQSEHEMTVLRTNSGGERLLMIFLQIRNCTVNLTILHMVTKWDGRASQ